MIQAAFLLIAAMACDAQARGAQAQPATDILNIGRNIFENGIVASGDELVGKRDGGLVIKGRRAACATCHQRSGFGAFEASVFVPPVTGPALFANARLAMAKPRRARGMRYIERPSNRRPAYTDDSLGRALRAGVSPLGEPLQFLMPRYTLDERNMAALTAYLKQLSAAPSPGIEGRIIHVATVVTPGQQPVRQSAMLDILGKCLDERYPEERDGATAIRLHVWQLQGDAQTWASQLDTAYAQQPAFALLSGLGGGDWRPIHDFCQRQGLPCLFPNVYAPGSDEAEHHNFYFSQGVVLEARVAAKYVSQLPAARRPKRIVQVFVANSVGAVAAHQLRQLLATRLPVVDHPIAAGSGTVIADQLSELTADDGLILWLDRDGLKWLADKQPPHVALILGSGWLGGTARGAIAPAWMKSIRLIHPFDAPARLDARMAFNLRPWLAANGLSNVDETLQGNTFAACSLLTESIGRMRGNYVRERLIELIESYPAAMGNAPAAQAFPRFTLGPGQRFSSKGAYIVRFDDSDENHLRMEHDWIVP